MPPLGSVIIILDILNLKKARLILLNSNLNLVYTKSSRLFEFGGCAHYLGFTIEFTVGNLINIYIVFVCVFVCVLFVSHQALNFLCDANHGCNSLSL